MATQKLSPKERAARQARKCLEAGAAHPLLKAAGHEKCWKCGSELQEQFVYDDFVYDAAGFRRLPNQSIYYDDSFIELLKKQTPFGSIAKRGSSR